MCEYVNGCAGPEPFTTHEPFTTPELFTTYEPFTTHEPFTTPELFAGRLSIVKQLNVGYLVLR